MAEIMAVMKPMSSGAVLGGDAAAAAARVPGVVLPVRVGDHEVAAVGLRVPVVGLLGLAGAAEAAGSMTTSGAAAGSAAGR